MYLIYSIHILNRIMYVYHFILYLFHNMRFTQQDFPLKKSFVRTTISLLAKRPLTPVALAAQHGEFQV